MLKRKRISLQKHVDETKGLIRIKKMPGSIFSYAFNTIFITAR